MIYEYDLTIPANTPATAPAELEMEVTNGIVHKLELTFPWGCNGAVLVVLRRGLHQVWPTNPDGQIKANGWTVSFPVWYPIEEAPFSLTARGWSPGTTYSHVVSIRLGVQLREVLAPPDASAPLLRRISDLIFGRGR